MPSSTSSSRRVDSRTALWLLLAALVAYFAVLETGMRLVLPSLSRGQARERADYRAASAIRALDEHGKRTALFIGNSLLLEGTDRAQLISSMGEDWPTTVFPVEGTLYWDWYFGMRRLISEGARPSTVILCINARQLVSDATHGEAFAHSLMRLTDVMKVSKAAGLDSMTTSSYAFANLSAWLGGRVHLRNGLLEKAMPDSKTLAGYFVTRNPEEFVANDKTINLAVKRLRDFKELVQSNGSEFVWLVPPTLAVTDPAPAIQSAAAAAGIRVVMPFEPAEMSPERFADGFHLGPSGAALFTKRTAVELKNMLAADYGDQ